MLIERNLNGSWCITDSSLGYSFTRVYYGYTKKEAMAEFREDIKEEKKKIITEQK